jgi:hypothetical protein
MNNFYSTIDGLKRFAKKLQREIGCPLHEAQDRAAKIGGFQNFTHARRSLERQLKSYPVKIDDLWKEYLPKERGSASVEVNLDMPMLQLIKAHNLYGYLSGFALTKAGGLTGHPDCMVQQRDITVYNIARAARSLQFIAATGLKPSSADSACYPKRDWNNRPPIADHDHCWYDPDNKVHILMTEPYPGRAQMEYNRQKEWEARHEWQTFQVYWGSIYGLGTEMYLCCPASYAEILKRRIAVLEQSDAAFDNSIVRVETRWKAAA